MITIHIDKLYKYARTMEPCSIGFPLPKGALTDTNAVRVLDKGTALPLQAKATPVFRL